MQCVCYAAGHRFVDITSFRCYHLARLPRLQISVGKIMKSVECNLDKFTAVLHCFCGTYSSAWRAAVGLEREVGRVVSTQDELVFVPMATNTSSMI